MTLRVAGSLILELKKQNTDTLDKIILTDSSTVLPLFMTTITYVNNDSDGLLQAEFDISYQNAVMDAGHYCLNLFSDGEKYNKLALMKETDHNFEQVLTVPVSSVLEDSDNNIKVKFTVDRLQLSKPTVSFH